jgi:hypothetical protein
MSFQAWAASWSAYTVATSGRIVPSSSSRAILPSPSPDGASLIIKPDTWCFAVSSCDTGSCESCWVNQIRACKRDWNNPAKAGRTSTNITAHSTATKRASGSPLGAIKAWKTRMLTITGASTATANGT